MSDLAELTTQQVFRAARIVCCVESPAGVWRKILQVGFQKSDGSLSVSFPYYEHTTGLINAARLRPGSTVIDLTMPGARVTSHLVKYSHHPDGNVHFSQDGKVLTRVRRKSAPLDAVDGHMFTTQFQGLGSFAEATRADIEKPSTVKRACLNFRFADAKSPEAVKIVGYFHTEKQLRTFLRWGSGPLPGVVSTMDQDGVVQPSFVVSAPLGEPGAGRLLVLTCASIPRLTEEEETTLTFIGGFEQPGAHDPSRGHGLLTLSYPAHDEDVLRKKLGSIDLPEGTAPPSAPPGRNDPCWCGSDEKFKRCHGR